MTHTIAPQVSHAPHMAEQRHPLRLHAVHVLRTTAVQWGMCTPVAAASQSASGQRSSNSTNAGRKNTQLLGACQGVAMRKSRVGGCASCLPSTELLDIAS